MVISSKLFWPFLFAAVAVPVLLPRELPARNRWSALIGFSLMAVSAWLFWWLKNDLVMLWQQLQSWRLPEVKSIEALAAHLKWALVVLAINFTILYILLYRLLHRIKLEQLLYFFVLLANCIYIILPDPIIGEVDDVLGIFITAFLSLSIMFDRILARETPGSQGGQA